MGDLIDLDEFRKSREPENPRQERFEEVMKLLHEINQQGTTILMATHDSSIVNRRKKRVIQLKDGKIVSDAAEGRYI